MTLTNVMFYMGGTWQQTPAGPISLDAETKIGELTTDHPASSYGQPVAVIEGQVYGPGDGVRMSGHETWRVKDGLDGDVLDDLLSGAAQQQNAAVRAMIDQWAAMESR